MSAPLVSIVIPTFKPSFLEDAIESALAQTYPAIEILVSDQCPTDQVREIIERYPQIEYRRNRIPGVYSNFRNCMRIARGEFVKFLLDDDLLRPDCVAKMVQTFAQHDRTTLVSSWYELIDANGAVIDIRRLEADRPLVSTPGGSGGPMLASARNPIGPLTTNMFRRRSMPLGIGPWFFNTDAPNRYFGLMDMSIILDLAFQGRAILLPEYLSAMRMHDEQLSNPGRNPRLIHSIKSWLPLADDAYAFGLLSDQQHQDALLKIFHQFQRFLRMFPSLQEDITALQPRITRLEHKPRKTS
jgi:glycosyltransferase involved in cell wall biosynthesis